MFSFVPFCPKSYWSVWLYKPEPPYYEHVNLTVEEAAKLGIRADSEAIRVFNR